MSNMRRYRSVNKAHVDINIYDFYNNYKFINDKTNKAKRNVNNKNKRRKINEKS